jgi:hypothetical protein
MLNSRTRNAWIGTAFAFLALAATALGQMHPGGSDPHRPVTTTHPSASAPPINIVTMPPVTNLNPLPGDEDNRYVKGMPPGTKVALSRLPSLPVRTIMNTVRPRNTLHGVRYRLIGSSVMARRRGKGLHPFAATGVNILFQATAASCTSSGTVGALYNVGCSLTWGAMNICQWDSTRSDTYQYYVIAPNSSTATTSGSSGTAGPANGCDFPPSQSTTLSTAGTYMFGLYDTTQKVWVAVAYAQAGQAYSIGVYQDSFHLNSANQFSLGSSAAAYLYVTGLAPADYYVLYVMSTGYTPYCAFIAPLSNPTPLPGPTPTGTANALACQPVDSSGQQATGTNQSISATWTLSSSTLQPGTYSVVLVDCNIACNSSGATQTTLAQTQVSLNGTSNITILTEPDGTTANSSPNPQPSPTTNTAFDWDSSSDQSDSGVTGTAGSSVGLTSGHQYTWTMTDPDGQVVAYATPAALPTGTTSLSQTFNFNYTALTGSGGITGNTMNPPGTYPSNIWTLQLYDKTAKSVTASQAFKILGYASETQFVYPSVTGSTTNSIGISTGSTTVADLRITNTSNQIYPNAGDSFGEVEFSTGPNFALSNSGNGIVAQLNGCASSSCSGTATDSNGNTWNVNTSCSSTTSNNAECNILLTPAVTGTTLTPGAYVTVVAVNWKNTHGASGCGTACQGITSELPVNGLTWSGAPTATVAWTPVYFAISPSDSGTASFAVVGSIDCTTGTRHLATPPPFVGTHCYQDRFNHADYQNNSPFSVTNSNESIWAFTITNNAASVNSISELEFQQPTILYSQGGIAAVDTLSSTNWQSATCPSGYGAQWFCITGKGGTPHSIAAGGTETIYLDANWPNTSMTYNDFAVLGTQTPTVSDVFSLTAASGSNTTIDGLYTTLDNLAVGAYSLNSALMSTYFSPTTVGTGQTNTPLSIVVTNTSTSQDANPDSIDAIVIEQSTNKNWTVTGTPTISASGWSYLNTNNPSGNTLDYWFGLCGGQYVTADGPPSTNPTTAQNALPECTLPESSSLEPGQSMTINMNVLNFGSPSSPITFKLYAHGANGNGWSTAKTFNLLTASETASIAFTKVNSTTISNPTVPSVGAGPNTYQYSIKNTGSGVASIGTVVITLPGTDVNGYNATDSSGNTWTLVSPISSTITLSGSGSAGCTVNTSGTATFSASTSGANGQITISGCTGLTPGNTLVVQFQANNPQSQSDSYLFPATIDGSSTGAGALYLGANEVSVSFSIGLSLAVDPSNPTNGKAHPVPACSPAQCAFSGTTLDFGSIANTKSVTGTDVVAASVIYTGATSSGHTWSLSVSSNTNPACTGGTCAGTNEMLADVDSTASGSNANGCGAMTYNQTSLAVVPTASTLQLATGPETQCSFSYDVIDNYKISIGTESINGTVATVTYTLIAN